MDPHRAAAPETPARATDNTPAERRSPTARCSPGSCSCCAVGCPGTCCRAKWAAARARPAGGGWCAGSGPASGSACTRSCWPNCAAAASSIWRARRRQRLPARAARGKKTGPNPTDRRKAGSKHHVLTDAHGIPLVARLTAANRHDVTQLLPLVDAIPPVHGAAGRPARKPQLVQGDRGYDSQPHRDLLPSAASPPRRQRGTPHGSGLGRTRWVVERTLAWLHRFRRLAVRYERRPCVHEAFLTSSVLARLLVLLETRDLILQRALSP